MHASRRKELHRPASYYRVAGLDVQQEMRRLCTLPVFGGAESLLAQDPPTLSVRRASARPRCNLGFAVPAQRRISVTAYPGIRVGDAQETLLHELVHIAVGRKGRSWHGRVFRRTLEVAMQQAYGVSISTSSGSVHGTFAEALEQRRRSLSQPRGLDLHPQQLGFDLAA
jgi:hypothetical protein